MFLPTLDVLLFFSFWTIVHEYFAINLKGFMLVVPTDRCFYFQKKMTIAVNNFGTSCSKQRLFL